MLKKIIFALLLIVTLAVAVFLVFAPAALDKSMNLVTEHQPYKISKQAKELHQTLIIGDWHADTLLWNRDIAKKHDYSHVDIPRLQAGNVSLQMFTTVTKSPSGLNYDQNSATAADSITKLAIAQRWPMRTWNSLTERALYQAQKLHKFEKHNSDDLVIIKSKADLAAFITRRASNKKIVGGLIGTEGSHALDGKIDNVEKLFDAGFRMMSLQHFFDNKLGASLHGVSQAGITQFGRDVVAKIEDLNIILDVSHSSEKVVADVLSFYSKPLVVSHTGFKGYCDTARNISDDLMIRIASNGGLIAVGYWDGAVCGEQPKDVVAAMKYGLSLVGEDHISLGSDFDGTVTTGFDTSELVALTDEMLKAGFTETQIRKIMGENMLRFLRGNLPN
jgi:microsomal dipeptidase-like Zn-dependent dipeptidase